MARNSAVRAEDLRIQRRKPIDPADFEPEPVDPNVEFKAALDRMFNWAWEALRQGKPFYYVVFNLRAGYRWLHQEYRPQIEAYQRTTKQKAYWVKRAAGGA